MFKFRDLHPQVKANREAVEFLFQWPLPQNVWINGESGRGKSHLARCVLWRYKAKWQQRCEHTRTSSWLSGPQLRNIANELPNDRKEDIEHLSRVDLLIIDDMDKVNLDNAKPLEVLWSVLEGRQQRHQRTLITSNMTAKALVQVWKTVCASNPTLPMAIIDRIKPCKGFTIEGPESLRGVCVPEPMCIADIGEIVAPGAAQALQRAVSTGNLAALASMEGE